MNAAIPIAAVLAVRKIDFISKFYHEPLCVFFYLSPLACVQNDVKLHISLIENIQFWGITTPRPFGMCVQQSF